MDENISPENGDGMIAALTDEEMEQVAGGRIRFIMGNTPGSHIHTASGPDDNRPGALNPGESVLAPKATIVTNGGILLPDV